MPLFDNDDELMDFDPGFDFTDDSYDLEIETNNKLPKSLHSSAYRLARKEAQIKLRKETAKEILDSIGEIEPGWSVDIVANGACNAGGFYEVYRDRFGTIDSLVVSTWIINRHYIDMLADDLDTGRLGELVFIISNRMRHLGKGHTPNFNRMKTKFMERKVPFRIVNSHAKTYALKAGNTYLTVDGSGNWSENSRIENYTISNDQHKYEFRRQWMLACTQL